MSKIEQVNKLKKIGLDLAAQHEYKYDAFTNWLSVHENFEARQVIVCVYHLACEEHNNGTQVKDWEDALEGRIQNFLNS